MKIVEIVRLEEGSEGTFGVLKIDKQVFCVTLERPDRLNVSDISSIPEGQYICKKTTSPKYGECFEVMNVQNRTHVLFHAGNVVNHTRGCILLAQYFGKLKGNRAVLNSGNTMKEFMTIMCNETEFHLTIKNSY